MGDCARSQNRPLWVCDRLAEELHSVPDQDNCSAREQLTLLSKVLYEPSSAAGGTTTRSTKPVAASITDKHFFSLLTISASSLTLLHFLLHHGFDAILVMLSPLVISFVATVTKCDPSKTKFAAFCPFSDISMNVLIASSSLQPTIAASFARCPR